MASKQERLFAILCLAILVVTFLIDTLTPYAVVVPTLYLAAIATAVFWRGHLSLVFVGLSVAVLTTVGGWLSFDTGHEFGTLNRMIVVVTAVAIAMLISRAESRRRQLGDRLVLQGRLLDAVGQAVIATDLSGRIIYWNRYAESLYGWRSDEALGQHAPTLTSAPNELNRGLAIMEQLRGCGNWEGEYWVKRKDGSCFPAYVTIIPMSDDGGRLNGLIGISTDITERKQMEHSLRQSDDHLRLLLEDREQLAEDLHDGIIQSLYGVGLQVDTLKSILPSNARMARQATATVIDSLNVIIKDLRRHILWQVPQVMNEDEFKQRLCAFMTCSNHPISLECHLEEGTVSRLTALNAQHLFYVIQEALSNVIRHAYARTVVVQLCRTPSGIRLTVTDDGVGLPPTQTRGRGLSNMEARAVRLGGKLTIQGNPMGTQITLEVPLEDEHSRAAPMMVLVK